MKKFMLFAAAMMLSVSMFAGDGSTKAKAIEYSWENGVSILPKKNHGLWYDVDLNQGGLNAFTNPEANIVITNPLTEEITLTVTAYVGDESQVKSLTIAAGKQKSISISAALLLRMGIEHIYLYVETDKDFLVEKEDENGTQPGEPEYIPTYEEVQINVNTVESGSISFESVDFELDGTVYTLAANKETWYRVIIPAALEEHPMVRLTVHNLGAATTIDAAMSATYPATGLTEQSRTIGAGATITKEIDYNMVNALAATDNTNKKDGESVFYLRVKAGQKLQLSGEVFDFVPAEGQDPEFDATVASTIEVRKGETVDVPVGTSTFKVEKSVLLASKKTMQPNITITNGAAVTIDAKVALDEKPYSVNKRSLALYAGQGYTKAIEPSLIPNIADDEYIYGELTCDAPFSFVINEECKDENPVVNPVAFVDGDWNGKAQSIGSQWYAIALSDDLKNSGKNLVVTIETNEKTNISVEITLSDTCGSPRQSYKSTINKTSEKLISNSLFKNLEEENIYVRVETDKNITVKVAAEELVPTFTNAKGNHDWNDTENWNTMPTNATELIRIKGDAEVSALTVPGLEFIAGGTMTVTGGTLTVGDEGISGIVAPNQLIIKEGAQVVFNGTKNVTPLATVEMNIKATHDAEGYTYQAIGLPAANLPAMADMRYFEWLWNTGWNEVYAVAGAFKGHLLASAASSALGIVNATGKTFGNANQTLALPGSNRRDNFFANSYLANIDMAALCAVTPGEIFVNEDGQWYAKSSAILDANSAENRPIKVGEGFAIRTVIAGASVDLDYENMVANPASAEAPARVAANQTQARLTIEAANGKSDYLYLAMGEEAYAGKMLNGKQFINVYANANNDKCTFVKKPNLVGTTIALGANASTDYTLRADLVKGAVIVVKDLVNGQIITLTEGAEYNFKADANKTANRFQVIGVQNVTTGVENFEIEGLNKVIENGQVYIIKNGVKYNAVGQIVK